MAQPSSSTPGAPTDLRTWESMDLGGWIALRRVERVGCAGNVIARDNLMRRKLIEWVPGESGLRLTARGREALQTRDREQGEADMKADELVVLQKVRDAESGTAAEPIDAAIFADAIYRCIDAGWLELGGTFSKMTLSLTASGRTALVKFETVAR